MRPPTTQRHVLTTMWQPLRWLISGGVLALVILSTGLAWAQENQERPRRRGRRELTPEETLQRIRRLVLPQQKRWAREMIRKDPDSPFAKLAQELLDEYRLYDQLREERRRRDEARSRRIREFWKARQPVLREAHPNPITITNLSDEPVLYQIRGPAMQWAGPYRLRPEMSHRFLYPARFRRATKEGVVVYSLRIGDDYVFRRPEGGGLPRLYRRRGAN